MPALSTSQLRNIWGPPCRIITTRVPIYGGATISVDHRVAGAFLALSRVFERWNYPARPVNDQGQAVTGAYNCRAITGGTGYSLHAFGIAADFNWDRNPYGPRLVTDMPHGMTVEAESLRTNSGAQLFRWGGNYAGNKDAMHYEIVCTPADVASGIREPVAPTGPTTPPAPSIDPTPPQEIPVADVLIFAASSPDYPPTPEGKPGSLWFTDVTGLHRIHTPEQAAALIGMRRPDFTVVDMPGDLTWYRDMVTTQ